MLAHVSRSFCALPCTAICASLKEDSDAPGGRNGRKWGIGARCGIVRRSGLAAARHARLCAVSARAGLRAAARAGAQQPESNQAPASSRAHALCAWVGQERHEHRHGRRWSDTPARARGPGARAGGRSGGWRHAQRGACLDKEGAAHSSELPCWAPGEPGCGPRSVRSLWSPDAARRAPHLRGGPHRGGVACAHCIMDAVGAAAYLGGPPRDGAPCGRCARPGPAAGQTAAER